MGMKVRLLDTDWSQRVLSKNCRTKTKGEIEVERIEVKGVGAAGGGAA
jgi:hypothetical protein